MPKPVQNPRLTIPIIICSLLFKKGDSSFFIFWSPSPGQSEYEGNNLYKFTRNFLSLVLFAHLFRLFNNSYIIHDPHIIPSPSPHLHSPKIKSNSNAKNLCMFWRDLNPSALAKIFADQRQAF